jgi:hypothetical protein
MPANCNSRCESCQSEHRETFNGEVAIHFSGLAGLNKPIVWVFPHLMLCLDCGFAHFEVPERERTVLSQGVLVDGALVWPGHDGATASRKAG